MIPKIHSGNNFYGVIRYAETKNSIFEDSPEQNEQGEKPGSKRLGIFNLNIDPECPKATLSQRFDDYNESVSTKKSKTKKPVFHASLSLPADENVSDEQFLNIAEAFIEKMGFQEQPYVVYRHFDKSHHHVHLISTRIGPDGKKINDSNEAKKAIAICRELEIQFNLTQVIPKEADLKAPIVKVIAAEPVAYNQQKPFKQSVRQHLHYALNVLKVTSIPELKTYLVKQNIKLETTKAEGSPLPNNGMRFYGLDGAGENISYLAGTSVIKKCSSFIERKIEDNKANVPEKARKADLIIALKEVASLPLVNQKIFTEILKQHGYQVNNFKYRYQPNEQKKEEIITRTTTLNSFIKRQIIKEQATIPEILEKIKKATGISLEAGVTNTGKRWIIYKEKNKKLPLINFIPSQLFNELFAQICKPGAADPLQNSAERLIYLKPDKHMEKEYAPKIDLLYRILNKNDQFNENHALEAAKRIGIDICISKTETGSLKGLKINYGDFYIKPSDFAFNGQNLSSLAIKEKFNPEFHGEAIVLANNLDLNPPLSYLKPDLKLNDLIAPKVQRIFSQLLELGTFNPGIIQNLADKNGLEMRVSIGQKGDLAGLSVVHKGQIIKTSQLKYNNQILSSGIIKEGFTTGDVKPVITGKVSPPPTIKTLLYDVTLVSIDHPRGQQLRDIKNPEVQKLLAAIQEKYVSSDDLKSGLLPYHRQPHPEQVRKINKPTVVPDLRTGIINKGVDNRLDDIYNLKIY